LLDFSKHYSIFLFEWYRSNTLHIFFAGIYFLSVFFWFFFDL
jgi:hypothetical protein